MICKECGKEYESGNRFCPYCGSAAEEIVCASCGKTFEAENDFCPFCGTAVNGEAVEKKSKAEEKKRVQKKAPKESECVKSEKSRAKKPKKEKPSKAAEKKSRKGLMIGLVVILVIAAGVGIFMYIRANQSTELNLGKMMDEPKVEGYDGFANIEDDIKLDPQAEKDALSEIKNEDRKVEVKNFLESITYTADKTDNLSNGDEISITAEYDEALAEVLKLEIIGVKTKYKVSGLEEGEDLAFLGGSAYSLYWADFIFPDSSCEYIDEEVLEYYDTDEIELAINEIYARHGYIFENDKYKDYYQQFTWYKPMYSKDKFNSAWFNTYESSNIELLSQYR